MSLGRISLLYVIAVTTTFAAHAQSLRTPAVSDEIPISLPQQRPAAQQMPAIASNGTTTVVTWSEVFDDSSAVYAARFPLGAATRLSPTGSRSQHFPAIASGRATYVVAWVEGVGLASETPEVLMARLLDAQGRPIIDAPIMLSTDRLVRAMSVAFNGELYLVVWTNAGGRIVGQRITERGELLDTQPFRINAGFGVAKVASNGRDFLVVWSTGSFSCPHLGCPPIDVFAARVSGAGAALDLAPIPIANSSDFEAEVAVASNGSDYLVTYSLSDYRKFSVHVKRVTAAGLLLDGPSTGKGLIISSGDFEKHNSAAAWDGEAWLVVWEEWQWPNVDLLGVQISADFFTAPAEISIAVGPTREREPELAVVARGRVGVVYSRIASEYGGVERGFVRHIGVPQRGRPSRR